MSDDQPDTLERAADQLADAAHMLLEMHRETNGEIRGGPFVVLALALEAYLDARRSA